MEDTKIDPPLVFEDVHVRSRVVHLVFHSQTLEQLGVFEKQAGF